MHQVIKIHKTSSLPKRVQRGIHGDFSKGRISKFSLKSSRYTSTEGCSSYRGSQWGYHETVETEWMLESSPVLAHSLLYATLLDLWDQPCNGGESLSTISNAKAQIGFAREGTNILKVCWDLETCSVGIVHNAVNISQVTWLTPFFQWGDKPGGAWTAGFWVKSIYVISLLPLLQRCPTMCFGRSFFFFSFWFRDDWVVDELTAGGCHFPLLEFLRRFSGKLLTLQPLFWQFE